ncbi:MAG: tRNA (adenosine(37)-N6)-threonylcarbamoyltransferase complex dimerization subunit type 1 TsaB, partial [Candidatus Thioglobus sp.]|nr:tRNA (adenosine(37)-N6)-threonylcarbamoyltransferase complex dimerization subunit type 1 TsaB [Candidatus Thioglobus sp.]
MKLLAIDTCTQVCSVSLRVENQQTNRLVEGVEKSSSLILPLCAEVLAEAKITPAELDGIIYTQGPGSFTGVRMCVAVAQGVALGQNIPTIGFSTLKLLGFAAEKKYHTKKVAVALDARMGQVYWGIYQEQTLLDESLKNPAEVPKLSSDFIGVGSGWGAYRQALCQQTGITNLQPDFYPKAQDLIDLYLLKTEQKLDNQLALPTYLRNN